MNTVPAKCKSTLNAILVRFEYRVLSRELSLDSVKTRLDTPRSTCKIDQTKTDRKTPNNNKNICDYFSNRTLPLTKSFYNKDMQLFNCWKNFQSYEASMKIKINYLVHIAASSNEGLCIIISKTNQGSTRKNVCKMEIPHPLITFLLNGPSLKRKR